MIFAHFQRDLICRFNVMISALLLNCQ